MKNLKVVSLYLFFMISACANQNGLGNKVVNAPKDSAVLSPSYLALPNDSGSNKDVKLVESSAASDDDSFVNPVVRELTPIDWPVASARDMKSLTDLFEEAGNFRLAAEKMPVRDFINYVFGDLLEVNYVLDESLISGKSELPRIVTLNITDSVDRRRLFKLASDLLLKQNIEIAFGDGTFYIGSNGDGNDRRAVVGVGRNIGDVPKTNEPIMQVVPLQYGVRISVERTLTRLVKAKITPDFDQSVLFIEGTRDNIVHAIELIDLLDTPATRSQYVGLVDLNYLTPANFSDDVSILLENEGILAGIGKPTQRNLVLVPLEQLGAVAVFASNETLLNRVRYWANLIDVPGKGSNDQYFIYYPQYARAIDLGESMSALLGTSGLGDNDRGNASGAGSTGSAPSRVRETSVNVADLKMVIDERANALVFYTSGSKYRNLLPLMKKLDTMPKQVLLEIIIAEVSLQDEFKYGFEWALSRGEVTATTEGAFGVSEIGGLGLLVNGTEGPLTANFLNSNSLVNVLSNPSLMVRDGVSANINVGSDISVVGQTTQDPISGERQTTTSEYRQTGVDITVTPTVNAQGIVVMEINQTISNSVPSTTGAGGNPDIFERSLTTELVARSGQTVMMAGLISENISIGGSGAPGLSELPIIGQLFRSKADSSDRTELIMLVTPRVLETLEEWDVVIDDFKSSLDYLKFESL